jgi:hypothetical protein
MGRSSRMFPSLIMLDGLADEAHEVPDELRDRTHTVRSLVNLRDEPSNKAAREIMTPHGFSMQHDDPTHPRSWFRHR